jgi:hypothetical protein
MIAEFIRPLLTNQSKTQDYPLFLNQSTIVIWAISHSTVTGSSGNGLNVDGHIYVNQSTYGTALINFGANSTCSSTGSSNGM